MVNILVETLHQDSYSSVDISSINRGMGHMGAEGVVTQGGRHSKGVSQRSVTQEGVTWLAGFYLCSSLEMAEQRVCRV